MKTQKGSITVISLIMLLFLVILSGSWAIMMTQSRTNAMMDEKQQQAWYAAESGFKRAQKLLVEKNELWSDVTTKYEDINANNEKNFTKIQLTDSQDNNYAWYAISIRTIVKNKNIDITGVPQTGTTYKVISVGEYKGERKVITRDVKVTGDDAISNPETPETPTTPNQKPIMSADSIAQAGGSVTVNWGNFSTSSGAYNTGDVKLYGNSILRPDSGWNTLVDGYNTKQYYTYAGAYTGKLYTKVDSSAFEQSTYGTFTQNPVYSVNDEAYDLVANQLIYLNWPMKCYKKNTTEIMDYNFKITNTAGGGVLFVHFDSGTSPYNFYLTDGIVGPTTGVPFTLIFDQDVIINTPITNNVLIIGGGNVELSRNNGACSGEIMVLANGDVYPNRIINKGFISSDKNISLDRSVTSYTGQMQAGGNIDLGSANYILDYTVINDNNFDSRIPKMLLHEN